MLILLVACLHFGLVAGAARAQTNATAAEALFRAGREALQHGDAAGACSRFRESYRLDPAPGTLINIAICETQLGELGNAWRHYQEVVHRLATDDPRVAIAQKNLQVLEPRLPRLTITRATDAPPDTLVTLNGIELEAGSFDVALPMDPGAYAIEASSTGHQPQRYAIELKEGDRQVLSSRQAPCRNRRRRMMRQRSSRRLRRRSNRRRPPRLLHKRRRRLRRTS